MTLLQGRPGPAPARRRSPWALVRGVRSATSRVLLLGAALAWVALLWPASSPAGTPAAPEVHPAGHHHHGTSSLPGLDAAGGWLLMVVAMMWPLAVPATSAVARAAYRGWRLPLAAACVATFTVLWLAVGGVGLLLTAAVGVDPASGWWVLGWLTVAVAGTWSARRHRLLSRCGRHPVLAPGGRRGLASAVRAGAVLWQRCALLCGPVMLAMLGGHTVALMVCGSLAVWWESWHPRAWRDPVPALLLAAGALATVLGAAWSGVLGG